MKVPALQSTESVLLIGAVGVVAYLVYKATKLPGQIGDGLATAGQSVLDAGKGLAAAVGKIADPSGLGSSTSSPAMAPGTTTTPSIGSDGGEDESAAEAARLLAQAHANDPSMTGLFPSIDWSQASQQAPNAPVLYGGDVLGQQGAIVAAPQVDSPDASGLSVWGWN